MGKNSFVSMNVKQSDLTRVEAEIMRLMKRATPEAQHAVARNVLAMINSSGNVPVDTGELRSASHLIKDKFKKNTYTIGWTVPHAKKEYFGVHSEKVWKTIAGKRRVFYSKPSGIPFWDKPITGNKPLMVGMYKSEFEKRIK